MLDGLPILAKITAIVGVPSMIAMYLVWVLTATVASAAQADALKVQLATHVVSTEKAEDAQTRLVEEQTRLLRIICGEMARTDAARIACNK